MKKLTAILLIIFTAIGCCAKKETTAGTTTGFTVLKKSDHGGRETAGFVKASGPGERKALYTELSIDELPLKDDLKYDIVAVFMGQKNTGGYSITIESIRVDGTTTYLKKKETKPEPGGMVSMALTAPYVIVEIPKTGKVVIE